MSVAETHAATLVDELTATVGAEYALTDETDRTFFSHDVYHRGSELAEIVVQPGTRDELVDIVRTCHRHKAPMIARGGGASYTDGYLPVKPHTVSIDTSRLNRIVEINDEDMYVSVEPGVTWAELHEALARRNLRTPFWGPFSGIAATVGGSISQNSVNFGTGLFGTSGESVLAMEIVLANGDVLKTGSAAGAKGNPFYRTYGPDTVGLFTGDNGALGIKALITMRLMAKEGAHASCSFGFPTYDTFIDANVEIAKQGIVADNFGMDPRLQRGALDRATTTDALSAAFAVFKSSRNPIEGAFQVAKIGLAGRGFLKKPSFLAHFTTEGVDTTEAKAKLARVRKIASRYGAEVANTVPTIIRATPFMPLKPMVGPNGERWKPTHGILPFSSLKAFDKAFDNMRATFKPRMDEHKVYLTKMFMFIGTNAMLYEPTFLWQDKLTLFHERMLPADFRKTLPTYDDNPAGRELVAEMKERIVDLFHEYDASHLQIGKDYPYLKDRQPEAVNMIKGIKALVDPDNLMNPGALGLS